MPFDFIDHPADIALHAFNTSYSNLLPDFIQGWRSVAVESTKFNSVLTQIIKWEAESFEELAINMLNDLNFFLDTRGQICVEFTIMQFHTTPIFSLEAAVQFDDNTMHDIVRKQEIKAITFHDAAVQFDGKNYHLKLVLDI
ncbi:MAG: archease [Ignavibacteria bacterium]|nr:archease [Ignavibacteria bacterium]